jgi:predicted 3-demethylubiquinone-9 3-methyltransferase (glyoxalase superfamily)
MSGEQGARPRRELLGAVATPGAAHPKNRLVKHADQARRNIMASVTPKIVPHLWFDREAREAAEFYTSVFPDSRVTSVTTLRDTPSGDCDVVSFELSGQPFMAISAGPLFRFNESISFMVRCETQEEVDYYWEKLSAVPEAEQCGWLKDRYGLSWQIVPTRMDEMMASGTAEQVARVTQAFMPMKKLDLEALERAYTGG